jgi:hypothetical protein
LAPEENFRIESSNYQANGNVVTVGGQPVTLALTGAPIEEVGSNPLGGLVGILANPNVAFLLFTAGVLARNRELAEAGYHTQVHVEDHTSFVFLLENGKRLALRRIGDEYVHNSRRFTSQTSR